MKWAYFQEEYHNSHKYTHPVFEEPLKFIAHLVYFQEIMVYVYFAGLYYEGAAATLNFQLFPFLPLTSFLPPTPSCSPLTLTLSLPSHPLLTLLSPTFLLILHRLYPNLQK